VKRYLRLYNSVFFIIILFTASACSTYSELIVSNKCLLPDENYEFRFYNDLKPVKTGIVPAEKKSLTISVQKYLVKSNGFNPESDIMYKGVEETLKGNYIEAEILFTQVRNIITDGSVENNLAVIYELTKRKKEAHIMYMNALIKSPDNSKFRSNLLSFINNNKFTIEKKSAINTVQ